MRKPDDVARLTHRERADVLLDAGRQIAQARDGRELLHTLVQAARGAFCAARAGAQARCDADARIFRAYSGPETADGGPAWWTELAGARETLLDGKACVRVSSEEMDRIGLDAGEELRNLLAVDLGANRGGLLVIADRREGDFTAEDESPVMQLAQMARLVLERLDAEHLAAQLEWQNQHVLAGMAEGFLLVDRHWTIRSINATAAEAMGQPTAELTGRDLWQVLPSLETETVGQELHKAMQSGEETVFQSYGRSQHRWQEYRCTPCEAGLSVLVSDITARKRREWSHTPEDAMAGMLGGFWEVSIDPDDPANLPERMLLSVEQKEMIGFEAHELPDSRLAWEERVHPADRAMLREALQNDSRDGHLLDLEYRIRHRDGSWRWIWRRARAERDEQGRICRWNGIDWDVTERHHQEERQGRLAALVQHSAEAIIATDPDGIITDWNPAAEEMYGWSVQEALGRSVSVLVPEDRAGEDLELIGCASRGKSFRQFETVRFRKDGRRIDVSLTISPVRDSQGRFVGTAAVERDITDRKSRERELQRTALRLAQSNRDLEQFAYVASHDLQEPLRMVTGYLQLLERRYKGQLDDDADEFIAYAVDGANRMQMLINDLLIYSRVGRRGKEFAPTDCNDVFIAARANLQRLIESTGAEVTADDLPTVHGDYGQLMMLLQNLLSNGIKFRGEEPPRVHVSARPEGEGWTFSVADNGIGMEPQYFEKVFVIFQRLHGRGQYEGTGIGLAVCKRIVERHGGTIWVESTPGRGSTFHFTVPGENR